MKLARQEENLKKKDKQQDFPVIKPCPKCGEPGGLIYCPKCHGPEKEK